MKLVKGQEWEDARGNRWRVESVWKEGTDDCACITPANYMAGNPDRPVYTVLADRFVPKHRIVTDTTAEGTPVPVPPAVFDPKPGDCVRLKCGGPPMVVAQVSPDAVKCAWHLDNGALACEEFNHVILIPAPGYDQVDVTTAGDIRRQFEDLYERR